MLKLNTFKAHPGATHRKKRLGRGAGSGHGQTAGKGEKGQTARSGGHVRPGFEGGQTPLYRRIPKRGFKSLARRSTAILNVGDLEKINAVDCPVISLETLTLKKKVKGRHDRLVILGTGSLTQSFTVQAHKISPSAQEKIKQAGGKIENLVIPGAIRKAAQKRSVMQKLSLKNS